MTVMQSLGVFMFYAVLATFAQNAVFTRALGVSRLVRLVGDTAVSNRTFALLLALTQLISAPVAYALRFQLQGRAVRWALRPLVCVAASAVAYAVLWLLITKLPQLANREDALKILPAACFNTAVVGTILTSGVQNFTLLQTMGFALGSAVGYWLAVQIVNEAQRKLRAREVPASFRGLPITLVYIGILAMAIYGFTGHLLSI